MRAPASFPATSASRQLLGASAAALAHARRAGNNCRVRTRRDGAPRERPPTYGRVSRGKTGHVEAVRALYDPALVSYEGLLAVYIWPA